MPALCMVGATLRLFVRDIGKKMQDFMPTRKVMRFFQDGLY